jgi:Kef-type K+ transport system membrane component KefB
VLLTFAHAFGYLFGRLRQPRVIGEILGGLLLGPTVLGALAPDLQADLFPSGGAVPIVLDAVYQLGLLLLMFSAGAEIRSSFHAGERRTVAFVGVTGTTLPFVAGLLFLAFVSLDSFRGPAATDASFALVFGIAIAVTSIPVISRIMFDLGILETSFARVVLAVAVLEDVLLYVLLAIALGLVSGASGDTYGLPALLSIEPGSATNVAYHVIATLGFLTLCLALGPPLFGRVLRFRYNVLKRGSPIAFQVVFMLVLTTISIFLGVVPLFGAFVAGIVVAAAGREGAATARESIKSFAFAFFVPVYFALVGLRLDLIHGFDPAFFVPFFVFACVVKWLAVFVGARAAGESNGAAVNLAVAMNARGGPGIVLASVAFDAAIIDERFYASLVLLAVLTSLLAGSWLERVVRSGRPLREERRVAS